MGGGLCRAAGVTVIIQSTHVIGRALPCRSWNLSTIMSSSPPDESPLADPVPPGYIRFILIHDNADNASPFYLQIPLNIIASLCQNPRKYLLFLGWCVLGIQGFLAVSRDGEDIGELGGLEDEAIYYYVTPNSGRCHSCVNCTNIVLTAKHRFQSSRRP